MVHKIYPEVAIPPTKSPAQILVAEVESIRNGKQVSTVINGYGVTVDKLEAVGEFIKIIGTNSIHLVHYTNIELTFHEIRFKTHIQEKRLSTYGEGFVKVNILIHYTSVQVFYKE